MPFKQATAQKALMAKHCPYCGKSSEEAKFVQNYCINCYTQRVLRLELPIVVDLEICKNCDRVRLDGIMSEDFELFIEKRIKKQMKCNYAAAGGAVGGLFSFGCAICNKILVLLLGITGVVVYFMPIQPILGVVSIILLAYAVYMQAKFISGGKSK